MNRESFGTYLRGSYAPSSLGQAPYEDSSGSGMSFDKSFTSFNSYEFGFIYSPGAVGWKFGFEVLQSPELKDISGTDTGGTAMYAATSSFSVAIPKVGMEIALRTKKTSRIFLGLEYGMGNLTLQNAFVMTAAGSAAYPGVTDFREEMKAAVSTYAAHLGYEVLMSDTTTFCVDVGYRALKYTALTHNLDVTNFQGSIVKGDQAYNNDLTTARTLDLSAPYAGVAFRIWIN